MKRLIEDPSHRQREFGNASRIEMIFSFLAVLFAVTAIWGFTSSASATEWLSPNSIGGIAVLCFAACMAIAANGGIRKRFIALVSAFDTRPYL
jgi:succinate dehydrogenase/fumarate reductase cytochrome b subunit